MTSQAHYNPTKEPQGLLLSDAPLLLSHPHLPLETGVAVNSDGMTHVAASTVMRGVTPEMVDWWFGHVETTAQYQLWHPRDHVHSERRGPRGEAGYVGGAHLVHERVGGRLQKLRISFRSPAVYFGDGWEARFKEAGVGTAVCARVGLWDGEEGEGAALEMGHVVHLCHGEWYGTRMRSRFWLGDVEGVTDAEVRRKLVSERLARGTMQHCQEEMAFLASLLPDLYAREVGKKQAKLV